MIADRHTDRTVIVTGGASGIGRGVARRFGEEGANVVIADVRREPKQGEYFKTDAERPTDQLIQEDTAGDAKFIETDVSEHERVEEMILEVVDTYGRIDVLINNAGIFIPGDSQNVTPEEWDEVLGVDLGGTFYCVKYAVSHLVERSGHIVNVGSVNSSEGGGGPPYAAAKGAIPNLTRDLAVELGEHDVNVNAVCPGFVKTAIQDYQTEESMQRDQTLLSHVGMIDDIGDVAVFLASEGASFIHGQSIYVDEGGAPIASDSARP